MTKGSSLVSSCITANVVWIQSCDQVSKAKESSSFREYDLSPFAALRIANCRYSLSVIFLLTSDFQEVESGAEEVLDQAPAVDSVVAEDVVDEEEVTEAEDSLVTEVVLHYCKSLHRQERSRYSNPKEPERERRRSPGEKCFSGFSWHPSFCESTDCKTNAMPSSFRRNSLQSTPCPV